MMTQKTLQQILDVLKYSKYNYQSGQTVRSSYRDAISRVSNEYDVTYQTIGDACRRRLKLEDIDEFGELFRKWMDGMPQPLIKTLKSQTKRSLYQKIDSFFQEVSTDSKSKSNGIPQGSEKEKKVNYQIQLAKSDQRFLKAICEIEEKKEEKIIEEIVSEAIRSRMKQIVQEIS